LLQALLSRLVDAALLDAAGAAALRAAWAAGTDLDTALAAHCTGSEPERLSRIADCYGFPLAQLDEGVPSRELVQRLPARVLLRHRLLPLDDDGARLLVATSRPFDRAALDELALATGREVRVALAAAADIDRLLRAHVGVGADTLQTLAGEQSGIEVVRGDGDADGDLEGAAEDASIVRFVNQVLTEAIEARATDVHLEPFENELRVRYRIDGILTEANVPPAVARFRAAIVSRLKILSHLDIAEKRLPQDGRIRLRIAGREVDVRVSVIPMLHGEAVVLRLLDRNAALIGPEHLGMDAADAERFARVLALPHGICLVTGPTGSGKTTTLYAGLSRINTVDQKIVTIEDPVEYQLRGVNQIQVSEKTGLTFAAGLRAILRHDPDVVLVGEIRDRETAAIAVQASLTGHLVLSTLHTNDAPGALTRLVDMGVEPYLVASSLELVVAQRLVRLTCAACRAPLPEQEQRRLLRRTGGVLHGPLYAGSGCRECQHTGYRGRAGIFELMPMTERIRARLLARASAGEIRAIAIEQGMRGLRDDGLRLVAEGRTTLAEVLRVTRDEAAGAGDAALPASQVDPVAAA
jgi:general secretion pathway protein E/type IV pilus assembly protein PilB